MSRTALVTAAARAAAGLVVAGLAVGLTAGPAAASPQAAVVAPAAYAQDIPSLPYGPDTCIAPYVWRAARPGDSVCVTVATRTTTAAENAQGSAHRFLFGGDLCAPGYTFRAAYPGDRVCVTYGQAAQVIDDNLHAQQRYARNQQPVQVRIEQALSQWMTTNAVANGSMAVMQNDVLIGEFDKGPASGAETAVPVASLSKAITAVGVMTLIDSGRLTFSTTLSQLPASFLTDTGIGDHLATMGSITIEDLLRHESGIVYDAASRTGLAGIPNTDDADLALIKLTLAQPLGPRGVQSYNDINYAILGRVISSITGENYESYVKRMVLTPRGAPDAHIGAGIRGMGAYGGWVISPVEYAMFARSFDPGFRMLSPQAQAFIDQGASSTTARCSLGMFVTTSPQGRNLWHFGNWSSSATTPQQFGSYYAMWNNGVAVAVTYGTFLTQDQQNSLDQALRNAAGIA